MANEDFKNIVDNIVDKSKDVFEKATQKVGEYAKTAGDTASDLFEKAKTRVEIEKTEYAMSKKFKELGKAYFEAKTNGETLDDEALLTDLKVLNEALEDLKEDKPISDEAENIIEHVDEEAPACENEAESAEETTEEAPQPEKTTSEE